MEDFPKHAEDPEFLRRLDLVDQAAKRAIRSRTIVDQRPTLLRALAELMFDYGPDHVTLEFYADLLNDEEQSTPLYRAALALAESGDYDTSAIVASLGPCLFLQDQFQEALDLLLEHREDAERVFDSWDLDDYDYWIQECRLSLSRDAESLDD